MVMFCRRGSATNGATLFSLVKDLLKNHWDYQTCMPQTTQWLTAFKADKVGGKVIRNVQSETLRAA